MKIMNACDAYLDAKNGSLALAAMYLFTDCIRTLGDEVNENNVVADFMAKAKPQISRFLNLKGDIGIPNKPKSFKFCSICVKKLPSDASNLKRHID